MSVTFLHSSAVSDFVVESPYTDPPVQPLLLVTVTFTHHLDIGRLVFPECDPTRWVVVYSYDPGVSSAVDTHVIWGALGFLLGE